MKPDADWRVLVRYQVKLTQPVYEKRARAAARIPNFWPLVFEQAPPDIDEFIQPSDSALLLSSLTSLDVSRFDPAEPRSIAITMSFAPNDVFEDTSLTKRFWHRRAPYGTWAGLVSEPVEIRWKRGRDLTNGLLGMVKRVWDAQQRSASPSSGELAAQQKALRRKIESTGIGGLSFFAWFGYVGRRISAEESREAIERELDRRRLRREGKDPEAPSEEEDGNDDDELEIFPAGDELAVAITEDLWPGAIRYFSKCGLEWQRGAECVSMFLC